MSSQTVKSISSDTQRVKKVSSVRWQRTLKPRHTRLTSGGYMSGLAKLDDPSSSVSSGPARWRHFSAPNLEVSEVSLETERFAEDDVLLLQTLARSEKDKMDSFFQQGSESALLAIQRINHLVNVLKSQSIPSSPFFYAAVAGFFLPSRWIVYGFMLCVLKAISDVAFKWASFVWNDREVIVFRKTVGSSIRRIDEELQVTLRGSYARQLMASYIYCVSTAPGESFITAFVRYQTRSINQRMIEEFENMKDRFYGYRKDKIRFHPL